MSRPARERLPQLAAQWDVQCDSVQKTATSLIAYGTRAGERVVIKLVHDGSDEAVGGAVAAAFDAHGMVPVLAHVHGAVLMQRLAPGMSLVKLVNAGQDERAGAVIGDVVRRMLRVQPHVPGVPTAEDWGRGFERYAASGDTQIERELLHRARAAYDELCGTQRARRLLHGDLPHYNILHDDVRGWVAVDPKGVVAEVEFEFCAALRNPHHCAQLYSDRATVVQRLNGMTEGLTIDRDRALRWAFAQAVLSLIWTLEEGGAIEPQDPALLLARSLYES